MHNPRVLIAAEDVTRLLGLGYNGVLVRYAGPHSAGVDATGIGVELRERVSEQVARGHLDIVATRTDVAILVDRLGSVEAVTARLVEHLNPPAYTCPPGTLVIHPQVNDPVIYAGPDLMDPSSSQVVISMAGRRTRLRAAPEAVAPAYLPVMLRDERIEATKDPRGGWVARTPVNPQGEHGKTKAAAVAAAARDLAIHDWHAANTLPAYLDTPAAHDLFEAIWRGELGGFAETKFQAEVERLSADLAALRAGRKRPSQVVGTGYKNPRVVAEVWLERALARAHVALTTRGRSDAVNRSNVRNALRASA